MKAAMISGMFLCLGLGRLCAQTTPDTMRLGSLSETLSIAIHHNPTQAVYTQQVTQARYNYKATKGAFYPNASASFGATDNLHLATTPIPGELVGAPGTTYDAHFGKKYAYNTGVTLTQNIFDWQAVLSTKIAGGNLSLTQSQQMAYIQTLKEQVSRTYFSLLIAKASLWIITDDEQKGDSLVALASQRLQEGTGDAISVNQALINRNNVQQNRAASQQLYDQGIENLKILLGTSPQTEMLLTQDPGLDSISSTAILPGEDKGLDIYRQQVSIAELQRRSQRSVAYPNLSASAYFGAQQFRDNFGLTFDKNAWAGYRYIGLNLTVPLFTGFSNTNKYRSAVIGKQIAQLQYENARDQSTINDRLLLKNQADYGVMVKAAANNFHLYGDNLQLNKQKYEEGVATMDVYLKAFQDYLTAENTWLNDLSQLLSIRATLISRQ